MEDDGSLASPAATLVGGDLAERRLQDVLDSLVAAFGGWTIGYQLGFALRLPAIIDASAGLILAVAAVVLVLRWRASGPEPHPPDPGARLSVLLILGAAVGLAALSTFMNRPDADDITLFPRAAAQLNHLWDPMLTNETTSDVASLPGASVGYLLTSYEFLVALAARLFGVDPLSAYQNGGAALGSALVPPLYYLVFRKLGLRPLLAVAAVAGVVAFLLLDGNDHRSMGNLAFVRLWQGKAILLTLLPAYLLLHSLQYVWRGSRRAWLCVLFAGVGATGLSTVGCFFAPAAIVVTTIAVGAGLLAARQVEWRVVLRRVLKLLLAVAYPLAVMAAILLVSFAGTFGPLEWGRFSTSDPSGQMAISDFGDLGWYRQLLLPASSILRMIWALLIVAAAPLLSLRRPQAYVIALFAPLFILLVANPVAGGLLERAVPEVYWRFFSLLPVPLCCGLLVAVLVQTIQSSRRPAHAGIDAALAAALIVVFAVTISTTTVSSDNVGFSWKSPSAWKLDPATAASVGPALPALEGKRVLADEQAAVALALMDPSIRVLAQRPANTLVEFALAERAEEGRARVRAQAVVAGANATASDLAAFAEVTRGGVDAVVVRTSAVETVAPLLAATGAPWRRIGGDGLYAFYLK